MLSPWAGVRSLLVAGAVVWLATLPHLRLGTRWSAAAHASWSLGVTAGLAYLAAMARWTLTSGLHGGDVLWAWLLLALEVAAFVPFVSYAYELHDALGSRRWGAPCHDGGDAGGARP